MRVLKAIPVAIMLAAAWSGANAAADFITIRRTQFNLSDATPSVVFNFTLPNTLNRSTSTANSAVLDVEVEGAEFNRNEIYINPPTNVCTDDSSDANQAGSIGFVQEHDDDNLKTEWATNHIAFSSGLLNAGANQLMVCIRDLDGNVGGGTNLDDVSLRSVVLHYHTSQ